jgi:SAM-dependent methyltransferase
MVKTLRGHPVMIRIILVHCLASKTVISALVKKELLHLPKGFRVLEVGCGTGNVLRILEKECADGQVIGMDLFLEGLRFARRRVGVGLVQGDMQAPPFHDQFHLIGLFDVLEHLSADLKVLQNLRSMLLPGGALLLTVPAFPSLWSYFDEASRHIRRYELIMLEARLVEAGFKVDLVSYYMMSIFPLVWIQRKLTQGRYLRKGLNEKEAHDRTADELKIVPVANQILDFILRLETHWLRKGRRLPFGTSLLAVARKPV